MRKYEDPSVPGTSTIDQLKKLLRFMFDENLSKAKTETMKWIFVRPGRYRYNTNRLDRLEIFWHTVFDWKVGHMEKCRRPEQFCQMRVKEPTQRD